MPQTSRTLDLLDTLVGFPTVSRDSNLDLIDWSQSLFARIGPKTSGGICLSGHTDAVPVDGQNWTCPPFRLTRNESRGFGRGTTDMKGFLASALAMAERAHAQPLATPLSLVLSYDEEVLREMLPTLKPLMGAPDLVVVGEPTAMQIATGHKGKAALDVVCHDQAGHSALAPQCDPRGIAFH